MLIENIHYLKNLNGNVSNYFVDLEGGEERLICSLKETKQVVEI